MAGSKTFRPVKPFLTLNFLLRLLFLLLGVAILLAAHTGRVLPLRPLE